MCGISLEVRWLYQRSRTTMNKLRLLFQNVLGVMAISLGYNHKLSQFCDRCGRTRYLSFWAANDVWIAVAGNVNGCRHGAYCVLCFDYLARAKGIRLNWVPEKPDTKGKS